MRLHLDMCALHRAAADGAVFMLLQGLDFEARAGLMRPTCAERDAEVLRQRTWATQTDTKLSGFQEQLLTTGDRAAKTAGAPSTVS